MFWDNYRQARDRLLGTIVCFNKQPVYIAEVTERLIAVCYRDDLNRAENISLEDEGWNNFRDVPQGGFLNTLKGVYHVLRKPVRTVRHGLCGDNTNVFVLVNGKFEVANHSRDFLNFFSQNYQAFCMAVNDEYPSYEEIMGVLDDNQSLAFSRKHLIRKLPEGIFEVFRFNTKIGIVVQGSCILPRQFVCYREELEQKYRIPNVIEA